MSGVDSSSPNKSASAIDRVLDDLAAAVGELGVGEGAQAADVGEHRARLPKCAGEVLACGEVDGGLAAHGGVDHGEQRGGGFRMKSMPRM